MTVYATEFNPDTLQCTAKSVNSGFTTIKEARLTVGIGKVITRRMFLCDGVVFSDFPFRVDEPAITA